MKWRKLYEIYLPSFKWHFRPFKVNRVAFWADGRIKGRCFLQPCSYLSTNISECCRFVSGLRSDACGVVRSGDFSFGEDHVVIWSEPKLSLFIKMAIVGFSILFFFLWSWLLGFSGHFFLFFLNFIYLFLERGEGEERERETLTGRLWYDVVYCSEIPKKCPPNPLDFSHR